MISSIRNDLPGPFQQRVPRIEIGAIEAELFREIPDQAFADNRHFRGSHALRGDRRDPLAARGAEPALSIHPRRDIHEHPVVTDARPHGGSNLGDLSTATPDARSFFARPGGDVQFLTDIDNGLFQSAAKISQADSESSERQEGIQRQLAGGVEETSSAAIQPPHFNLSGDQVAGFADDVGLAPLAPDGQQRGMFTEKKSARGVLVAIELFQHTVLQKQTGVKIEQTKQVDVERRLTGCGPGIGDCERHTNKYQERGTLSLPRSGPDIPIAVAWKSSF